MTRSQRNHFSLVALYFCCGLSAGHAHGEQAVASAHPLATKAGVEILQNGGNAFDAAIAVSAVLAVVEPYSSGMGGGGFWLLYRARDQHTVMIDGRERAPLLATPALYLDAQGTLIPNASVDGPKSAAIPGTPAALVHLARKYGRLPLSKTLNPAVQIARSGFAVTPLYQQMAEFRLKALRTSPEAARIFLDQGQVPAVGTLIKQPELALTFEQLAQHGHVGFYGGSVAQKLVHEVRKAGGLWTQRDLTAYQVKERRPIVGRYKNLTITSVPPPSSGGVALVTMLNILKQFNLEKQTPEMRVHLLTEAMRRAYRDRAQYLGDPDFIQVPVTRLTSQAHARRLAGNINLKKATASSSLPQAVAPRDSGRQTTHFSIIDQQGNRVAATLTINYAFGSAYVVPGTGVLLNDEMDDFVSKPGVPNLYGLTGGEANAIAPGKRPLSSMTPTFIESHERVALLGTPGGSRIITMVLLALLEFEQGASAKHLVQLPRFHHQYLPDQIQFEPGALSPELQNTLLRLGHALKPLESTYGNMQVLLWNKRTGQIDAASDPRGIGTAEVAKQTPRSAQGK